jgi:hypothetical protein
MLAECHSQENVFHQSKEIKCIHITRKCRRWGFELHPVTIKQCFHIALAALLFCREVKGRIQDSSIWVSHSRDDEEHYLMGCDTV